VSRSPGAADGILLDVNNLVVDFGGVPAVNDVSFSVLQGQSVGLVGESGSGKSTVCLAIMGLLPKSAKLSGEILFDGVNLLELGERQFRQLRGKDIGLVYQDPMAALNPVRTIGSQLYEPLRLHLGMSRKEAKSRAIELMEHVGIAAAAEKLGKYPHEFSGGMRQRVVIAMAIACNPKLIVADEPTTALDVSVQAQVLDLLQRLTDEHGIALLLVSHDLGVVAGVVDDVAVMRYGSVVEYGGVRTVFENPREPYTRELLARVREIESGHEMADT
jgi:peptide/nickel transport system ATP-binding protein